MVSGSRSVHVVVDQKVVSNKDIRVIKAAKAKVKVTPARSERCCDVLILPAASVDLLNTTNMNIFLHHLRKHLRIFFSFETSKNKLSSQEQRAQHALITVPRASYPSLSHGRLLRYAGESGAGSLRCGMESEGKGNRRYCGY